MKNNLMLVRRVRHPSDVSLLLTLASGETPESPLVVDLVLTASLF